MDLNIRNVDEELVRRLKANAARAGVTLREHCISLLSGSRAPEIARESTQAPKIETPREVGKLAPCPRCDGPTLEWGTSQRRCPKCGQNWPR